MPVLRAPTRWNIPSSLFNTSLTRLEIRDKIYNICFVRPIGIVPGDYGYGGYGGEDDKPIYRYKWEATLDIGEDDENGNEYTGPYRYNRNQE